MKYRLLALCLLLALPAQADTSPQQRLDNTQRQLSESQSRSNELRAQQSAIDSELKDLRSKLINATSATERSEKQLDELESSLTDLEGTAARRGVQLAAQREQLSQTLALLQRLAITPPAAQLFNATPPLDRLRTDIQLKALLPEIQTRSAELAATVADMRVLQQQLEDKRRHILNERRSLTRQQADLNKLMDERSQRLANTRNLYTREQQRATRLASQAQNLRDLLDRLQQEKAQEPESEADTGPALSPQTLPSGAARRLPVVAPAVLRFGQKDPLGNTSKGLTLRPRPGAIVAAVASGRVAFAGPFRGYGRVLIVEHSAGYHTVLAGLGRITVEVGQRVAAGEPLGSVAEQADPPPEVYFEVRRNGTPVDPLGSSAAALTQSRSP